MKKYFSERAVDFYKNLEAPSDLTHGVEVMNPFKDKNIFLYVNKFFDKYFADTDKRIFVLGINPGRFGGGATGINFTDSFALEAFCGIRNNLDKRRELSSVFVYEFVNSLGGPRKFYREFFLSAISPLGFTRNGLNYNYYDSPEFLVSVRPFIIKTLIKQIEIGANKKVVIIFGTGKNQNFFSKLNEEYSFFEKVFVLEHPRFIMQYKKRLINDYITKYNRIFHEALLYK